MPPVRRRRAGRAPPRRGCLCLWGGQNAIDLLTKTVIEISRCRTRGGEGFTDVRDGSAVPFRLFTFLLDENGQSNYNIDVTEPKAWI